MFDGEPGAIAQQCAESNRELIASLREDKNSAELHRLTCVDFQKGRMSEPMPPEMSIHTGTPFCFSSSFTVFTNSCASHWLCTHTDTGVRVPGAAIRARYK